MSREGYVHLPGMQLNLPGRLQYLLVQAVAPYSASLISPVQHNDPATVYITFSMARLS